MAEKQENLKANNPFPKMEEEVLDFWDKAKIFEKSVERPAGVVGKIPLAPFDKGGINPPNPFDKGGNRSYVFYDGPPFGTGEPHYGHILSSIAKDVIPRFWTMQGFRVERRWGWDCHGLPIENIIEKDLGISGKKDIEKLGVAKFNEACRARVLEYADIWGKMIRRIGRWVDFTNSYKTMDLSYMESVWWAFKQLWQKKLIYQGRKVLLYCPRCETPISNFEVAMDNSYKDITEESVYVKFKIKTPHTPLFKGGDEVYILAWTTTPWTLPGNVALAVGEKINYVIVRTTENKTTETTENIDDSRTINSKSQTLNSKQIQNSKFQTQNNTQKQKVEYYILAKDRAGDVLKDIDYEIVKEFKGKELVGLEYEPLFDVPAFKNSGKDVFKVFAGDFVTTEDGTGVVHTAAVYGEEDYEFGLKHDLPIVPALDERGYFNDIVPQFKGVYFKKADPMIIQDLTKRGLVFKTERTTHSYPFCHRCDTQLFYNAIPAWFLNIGKIKKRMLELNEKINWFPDHLKHGRFALGIEQAPDWNISRNRYFATPIPIWQCDKCKRTEVIGSVEELEKKRQSKNNIYILRHSESEKNVKGIVSSAKDKYPLTEKGIKDAKKIREKIKELKIDLIFSSEMLWTKQTAQIINDKLGVNIIYDKRLNEVNAGELEEKREDEPAVAEKMNHSYSDYFWSVKNGESLKDVEIRIDDFWQEMNKIYSNKNILIVSHGDVLRILLGRQRGLKGQEIIEKIDMPEISQLIKVEQKITDIHLHFIDEITWPCSKGDGQMKRVREVLDGWVESGSMSFAQMHYPFANKEKFENNFPAQYISEYISQTRAWFYVMHVMSTALFDSNSFENVIATGVILNETGEKLSKSKKNFSDPYKVINQYGVDALRFYLMSSSLMQAENLFFNERELRDIFRKNIMILWNVYRFYELYASESPKNANLRQFTQGNANEREANITSNVLDTWIVARLKQLISEVTLNMKGYNIPKATRPISEFINDLSVWYIRRSRDRFKSEDASDKQAALATTKFVLEEVALIIAPVMPFLAEQIWQKVRGSNFKDENESVHLKEWPALDELTTEEAEALKNMAVVRKIVELGLAERDKAGIKVRQTLQKFSIFLPTGDLSKGDNFQFSINEELINLIKDELNVKDIIIKKGKGEIKVGLDTTMSEELKLEGLKREIVRMVNNLRKQSGLTIKDKITLFWQSESEIVKKVFGEMAEELKKDTLSDKIENQDSKEMKEVEMNGEKMKLGISKK